MIGNVDYILKYHICLKKHLPWREKNIYINKSKIDLNIIKVNFVFINI